MFLDIITQSRLILVYPITRWIYQNKHLPKPPIHSGIFLHLIYGEALIEPTLNTSVFVRNNGNPLVVNR